ncbi:MAG: NUDIX hydrolase [Chlamydiia bacterium]|nr:NUDIX hydrolase [Chlamydiia bacterium]
MSHSKAQEKRERAATVKRKQVHQGKIIEVVQDEMTFDNQLTKTFDLILHPGAVALIPITAEGEIIFVKQWRRAAQKILIELPAGTLEKGEDPIDCAVRELREETGMRAIHITPLTGFYSAPGVLSEYLYLYLAKELVHDPLVGDDTDEIDLLTLSLEEARQKVHSGEIQDAKTILGILWLSQQMQ